MIPTRPGSGPHLVEALGRIARRDPVARKLLVTPNHSAGRELLRRLALTGDGWIGFEVMTPGRLAQRIALPGLERAGLSVVDRFEHQATLDRALDSALAAENGGMGELSEGVGFREKVHGAVTALRLGGIEARQLDAARFIQWEKKLFLLRVLQRYERLLSERRKADPATVLRLALAGLEDAGGRMPPTMEADHVLLMPGLPSRGLQGRLVGALSARGAKLLETDPVLGLDAPDAVLWGRCGEPAYGSFLHTPGAAADERPGLDLRFFSAASIESELREVLRRVVEAGAAWDEVEIVTPDPAAYGSALHALATRLGIPVTYAVGLPVGRTRTGRVVRTYLDWIEEGFQADPVRRLLEAGDLRPRRARDAPPPAALARRFRSLRVGWGRKRYRAQIRNALDGVERMEPRRGEPAEPFERRRERARREIEALKTILFPALRVTPAVPDRMDDEAHQVSPAEIATGLEAFLRRVPKGRGPDRAARDEVARILDRIQATLTRRTEFRAAVAILKAHLDIRVRPDIIGDEPDGAGAPWSSTGGALHMSDIEHGGFTGRPMAFLVGLDADRVPGVGGQDPVLLDSDRRVLGGDLPTSAELLKEKAFRLAALFARLPDRVTLSWGAWQATEARALGPSSLVLQALRLARRDDTLTFEDLRSATSGVVSALPRRDGPALDADDAWMMVLGSGGVMLRGVDEVRAAYARLDAGLDAWMERRTGVPGPVHGVITPRPDLDPRANPDVVVSASRLEALGACPLKYLHSTVLRIYPPDDPELDPETWLDPRQRGSLLHSVYDAALRGATAAGVNPDEAAFESDALAALAREITRFRHEVPTPGEGTLAREEAALREDVRSFVRMIRQLRPQSVEFELRFGLGEDDPVVLSLPGGPLRLRGAIDRVDRDLAGLHVVDYKTGGTFAYGASAFNGGRLLQHAVYAAAADERLEGDVVDGQYHFPTRKGQNQAFVYSMEALAPFETLLATMLDGVAEGHFVPTDTANDCTFCDFSEICRVTRADYGSIDSPLAEWSQEHANTGLWPAFRQLKVTRSFE